LEQPVRAKTQVFLYALTLLAAQIGCGGTSSSGQGGNPGQPGISVTVAPNPADIRLGDTQPFSATVSGSSNQTVTWQVNGTSGGSAATGTISTSGLYTPPANFPNPDSVTVQAVSAADSTAKCTSSVTLWNPIPILSTVNPPNIQTGSFTLNLAGSNFVNGATVSFGGTNLSTTFVSSTQLTATGNAAATGTVGVSVTNPNPGTSTSGTVDVQVGAGGPPPSACSGMSLGQSASLNGFLPFPSSNAWNQDISGAPVDPNSDAIINFIGPSVPVHPDFGSGEYNGSYMGIPYVIVGTGQTFVPINLTAYGDESDPGPMPVPANAPIEGYPNPGSGDRHVLVLDNTNCWLYELYSSYPQADGSWNAGSAAVWDLLNFNMRPWTWTSADAAGLSIFAGLVRYDEVVSGAVNHAFRFTLQSSRAAFVPPATHWASNSTSADAAPMGMRMRLKASFDISSFSPANQVILKALQKYGMIMADNGSSMYITGAPNDNWNNDDLHLLGNVTASDFEVVEMHPIYTQSNMPQGAAPSINSFSAGPATISAGAQTTLSWSATGASYFVISPGVGAVRGTSVTVAPTATTTYTLASTNQFGRNTATATVTVQ
jgi:IPT/TIG domain-containing protein